MSKVTKKSMIEKLQSNRVKATMVGGITLDEWPEVVERIKKQYHDALELDEGIEFGAQGGSRRFLIKPKIQRTRIGRFVHSGTRYRFECGGKTSHGEISSLKVSDDGKSLVMETLNGALMVYEPLIEEAVAH